MQKKQFNKWIQLINIPFQMGLIIFVFFYAGKFADGYFNFEKNQITITSSLIGVAISMYVVFSQLKKIK
jgi:hypothetical protein